MPPNERGDAMLGSAPKPADEIAREDLHRAARRFAAYFTERDYPFADSAPAARGLEAMAVAYVQALKDAKRARRTSR